MWCPCMCSQAVKRHRVRIEVIPEDEDGDLDIAALEHIIAQAPQKPALIAITQIPTSSGIGCSLIRYYSPTAVEWLLRFLEQQCRHLC